MYAQPTHYVADPESKASSIAGANHPEFYIIFKYHVQFVGGAGNLSNDFKMAQGTSNNRRRGVVTT
jgi:hypothetical protein